MQRVPQEVVCPIPEEMFGALYRAEPQNLQQLVATISPRVRAMLALYCYPRSHLASMGLAVASTCEQYDLIDLGGDLGAALFEQAQRAPAVVLEKRRKVSLSSGALMQVVIDQDLI